MNQGVQILLERMRSNPDEFVPDLMGNYPRKWRNIIQEIEYRTKSKNIKPKVDEILVIPLPFLTDEEVDAVWSGMQQLQGDLFTKKVMGILLQDAEELSSFSEQLSNATLGGGNVTLTTSPIQNLGAVSGTISARTAIGKLRYP
jgi:hypothetical protein